jgi:hypothetical protein
MSPQSLAVHEQMVRHFSGILSALDKLLKEIGTELKEIREAQEEHKQS